MCSGFVQVEVERIDIGEPENSGAKPAGKRTVDYSSDAPNISVVSPDPKNDEAEDHQDIDIEDLFGSATPEDETAEEKENTGFDINMSRHNDSDDEIADVDDSGDEADKGPMLQKHLDPGQCRGEGRANFEF
ncbi:uncharacterized protein LOC136061377 [Quercus suber]|uniref:uncharacterized protein LOC136061377 n=1 Tax=Quercus suber TaxID=58331 RepID=UPI0032DE70C9